MIRLDRIAERPQLDAFEVAVWHHEGHFVKLKAGKVVEVNCDDLIVTAAVSVRITSPTVEIDASGGVNVSTPTLAASAAITAGTNVTATGKRERCRWREEHGRHARHVQRPYPHRARRRRSDRPAWH